MSAAEITSLILAGSGILATLLTFVTSARNTDLEAVKAIVKSQQDQIAGLQKELAEERAISTQLRKDLNAAHARLRELENYE